MISGSEDALALKGVEDLSPSERHEERVMLALRLAEGIEESQLPESTTSCVQRFIDDGLLWRPSPDRVAVTNRGRLLADGVITDILVSEDD